MTNPPDIFFLFLSVNVETNDYYDFINWSETKISCPPFLVNVSSFDIADVIFMEEKPKLPLNPADSVKSYAIRRVQCQDNIDLFEILWIRVIRHNQAFHNRHLELPCFNLEQR